MMRRMDHTGLTVSDMERSIDFYCNVLGLKLVRRMNVAEEFLSQIVGFHEVNLDIALLKADEEEHIIELLQYISAPRRDKTQARQTELAMGTSASRWTTSGRTTRI